MVLARREFSDNAVPTTIVGAIGTGDASWSLTDPTGWPTGATGPFWAIIDRLGTPEKVLVTSRSGAVLSGITRHQGGTSALARTAGATIAHFMPGEFVQDVSDHIYLTSRDDHTQYHNNARHDLPARHTFGAAFNAPAAPLDIATAAAAGSGTGPARSDHVHKLGAGSITGPTLFAAGAVDSAAILDGSIVNADINAAAGIAFSKLAASAWTAWTPTIAQGATNNIAKTVQLARYIQIGKIVIMQCWVTINAAGTAGQVLTFSSPVTLNSFGAIALGGGYIDDASVQTYWTSPLMSTSTTIGFWVIPTSAVGAFGQTPNVACASGDSFNVIAIAEAA